MKDMNSLDTTISVELFFFVPESLPKELHGLVVLVVTLLKPEEY